MPMCTAGRVRRAWAACVLAAPAAMAVAQPGTQEWVHTIAPGDTLLGLKARLLRPEARWQALQQLNRIADPRRLVPGAPLRIPLALLREESVQAEVLHSHGTVWLERQGEERQQVLAGTQLKGGDHLRTGPQSSASLRFADGTRTLVGPDSRLQLERLSRLGAGGMVDTRLRQDSGSLETQVPPDRPAKRLQIRTPSANLGVRGTEFRSRVDAARTLVEVLQGRVAAGAQNVDAGSGVAATASGVGAPRPLPPRPDLAAMADRVERLPLQLAVGTPAGPARYRAQVFADGSADQLLLDGLFDQPVAQWAETLADGRYELRVRAVDAEGLEGVDARKGFTLKARPEPPFLLRPRAGERVLQDSVTLAWSRNPDAASYRLQLSPHADFGPPLIERLNVDGVEIRLTLPPGTQHWRIAAVRADGDQGPWSDTRVFERSEPPPPPPGSPTPQAPRTSDEGPVLSWTASPLRGATYQIQVARDPDFTQTVLDVTTDRTEILLPRPGPGTYHVRLRTIDAEGRSGGFGSVQVIEVPRSMWWLWLLPLLLLL